MKPSQSVARRSACFALAGVVACLSCASCTDLLLKKYSDNDYLQQHQYRLGEQYVEVGGVKLCYQEQGQGDCLVILPGLATSIDFWQLNVPALAQSHRVLAVDPPGFGKSDKPDVPYDLDWICDQVVLFMDAKGVERASLMGASLGGHLAVMIAHSHPERVDKLILMGSCGAWPEPSFLVTAALRTLWNESIVADHMRRTWPDTFARLIRRQTEVTRELLRYQMAIRADGPRYWPEGRASARALRSIFFHSCRGYLSDVRQPTLLVWGESDRIHLFGEAKTFRTTMPDCRLVVVRDSAHQVILDQPTIFNELVRHFLDSGTAGVQDDFGGHKLRLPNSDRPQACGGSKW
jgi:pimeloyl-ACP methyl ester carboxylesterase